MRKPRNSPEKNRRLPGTFSGTYSMLKQTLHHATKYIKYHWTDYDNLPSDKSEDIED
jgi:hypothetical protein